MVVLGSAVAHDYFTQFGGAERVAIALSDALDGARIYTSAIDYDASLPALREREIITPHRRSALVTRSQPLLAANAALTFSGWKINADLIVASSTGWAHGLAYRNSTIVYCHSPARWLYESAHLAQDIGRGAGGILNSASATLKRWDRGAACRAESYIANSTAVRDRIWKAYGIDSEIIYPPLTRLPAPSVPNRVLPDRYALTVSRSRGYKHTDVVARAKSTGAWPIDLVIVGEGSTALNDQEAGVWGLGRVSDSELSYLYKNAECLIAVAYEDFGLTPLEANQAGTPVLALDAGGYRDTVVVGTTGLLIEHPSINEIQVGISEILQMQFSAKAMKQHVEDFSFDRFQTKILSKMRAVAGVA